MLTKGEDVQHRLALGDALGEQKERVEVAGSHLQQDYKQLEKAKNAKPTDKEFQKGNGLMTVEFQRRLKKLVPGICVERHSTIIGKCVFWLGNGLMREQVCPGEWPWMPEWSVLETVTQQLPAHSPEFVRTKEGYKVEIFRPGIPAMREVPVSFKEVERGWRTILMRLILNRQLTLDAAEREFGVGNRAAWAATLKEYAPQSGDFTL